MVSAARNKPNAFKSEDLPDRRLLQDSHPVLDLVTGVPDFVELDT